jgi:hypothetical protein
MAAADEKVEKQQSQDIEEEVDETLDDEIIEEEEIPPEKRIVIRVEKSEDGSLKSVTHWSSIPEPNSSSDDDEEEESASSSSEDDDEDRHQVVYDNRDDDDSDEAEEAEEEEETTSKAKRQRKEAAVNSTPRYLKCDHCEQAPLSMLLLCTKCKISKYCANHVFDYARLPRFHFNCNECGEIDVNDVHYDKDLSTQFIEESFFICQFCKKEYPRSQFIMHMETTCNEARAKSRQAVRVIKSVIKTIEDSVKRTENMLLEKSLAPVDKPDTSVNNQSRVIKSIRVMSGIPDLGEDYY